MFIFAIISHDSKQLKRLWTREPHYKNNVNIGIKTLFRTNLAEHLVYDTKQNFLPEVKRENVALFS